MKETDRNVIVDLLPLYLSGEASPETQALVDDYLESDPELAEMAEIARKTAEQKVPKDIPAPIRKEKQLEDYKQAQQMILRRTLIWGSVVALGILTFLGLALLAFFMLVNVP